MRDALTTTHEQQLLRSGVQTSPTLNHDAVHVDAIVNTGGWMVGWWVGVQLAGWLICRPANCLVGILL